MLRLEMGIFWGIFSGVSYLTIIGGRDGFACVLSCQSDRPLNLKIDKETSILQHQFKKKKRQSIYIIHNGRQTNEYSRLQWVNDFFLFNFYLPFSCNGGFVKIARLSQTDADLLGQRRVLTTCHFFHSREREPPLFLSGNESTIGSCT